MTQRGDDIFSHWGWKPQKENHASEERHSIRGCPSRLLSFWVNGNDGKWSCAQWEERISLKQRFFVLMNTGPSQRTCVFVCTTINSSTRRAVVTTAGMGYCSWNGEFVFDRDFRIGSVSAVWHYVDGPSWPILICTMKTMLCCHRMRLMQWPLALMCSVVHHRTIVKSLHRTGQHQ